MTLDLPQIYYALSSLKRLIAFLRKWKSVLFAVLWTYIDNWEKWLNIYLHAQHHVTQEGLRIMEYITHLVIALNILAVNCERVPSWFVDVKVTNY